MRIALAIEYDGSRYAGWQRQAHATTVQQVVEEALGKVANHPTQVSCAGRTDAGVHALGQVVHFDTDADRSMRSWVFGANANLPKDVVVLWAQPVVEHFHARFSALRRAYRYVIFNRQVRSSVLGRRVAWDYRSLDTSRMQAAAGALLGEHDFNAYRSVACQAKHPVRMIYRLDIRRDTDLILVDIEANGFLHHMVRNIAGVLMAIGAGEREPGWSAEVLAARDRRLGGVTAPPHGLYFMHATYPAEFSLPLVSSTRMVW